MLVFFEEGKTLCMLPTGNVKRMQGLNQTLPGEGAQVAVDYETKLTTHKF
jgi:hypothetical protein